MKCEGQYAISYCNALLHAHPNLSCFLCAISSLRMFNNEDVTIGSWMLAMNVYHEDNRAICDPTCTPTSIAVWDIPKCSGRRDCQNFLCDIFSKKFCRKHL